AGAEGVAISLCDGEEVGFLRDIEKLIRMTIPVNDRRADQRRGKPRPPTRALLKTPVPTQPPGRDRRGLGRKHKHTARPNETPRGIDSVAFIRGKHRPERDRAPHAQRWPDYSKGT